MGRNVRGNAFLGSECDPARQHRLVNIHTLNDEVAEAALVKHCRKTYLGIAVTRTNTNEVSSRERVATERLFQLDGEEFIGMGKPTLLDCRPQVLVRPVMKNVWQVVNVFACRKLRLFILKPLCVAGDFMVSCRH